MSYATECTGSATVDRQSTSYGGVQPGVHMDEAYAQRFVPTSRCLDSVILRMKRDQDVDVYIEVRNDSGGNPGNIGSGYLGQYRVPYTSIPTAFSSINIPFGIVLPDLNPKWIVMYSAVYDPNYSDTTIWFDLDGDTIADTVEYSSSKVGNNSWNNSTGRKFYFQTYKKTYVSCTVPGCGFVVA
jgi:hypothetical protein